jgi:hypothetical protein
MLATLDLRHLPRLRTALADTARRIAVAPDAVPR